MSEREQRQPGTTAEASSTRMVLVMGAVGLIASFLLVATYVLTAPYIAANRAALLEEAIFDVLPGSTQKVVFELTDEGEFVLVESNDAEGRHLYAGYDENSRLIGVAIEAEGQGFQDKLRLIYGYMPECECVVGMQVLESTETPGLGDKIETDEAFQSNFDSLDVRLETGGRTLLHDVTLVKRATETRPWEIAAITGATISSEAVAEIIDESAAELLPHIQRNLDQLRRGMSDANRAETDTMKPSGEEDHG